MKDNKVLDDELEKVTGGTTEKSIRRTEVLTLCKQCGTIRRVIYEVNQIANTKKYICTSDRSHVWHENE